MAAVSQSMCEKLAEQLDFITRHDGRIQAWQALFADSARAQADLLDHLEAPPAGPLDGLFVGVKDIFDFAGYAPGNGLPFALRPAAHRDATIVGKLKAAGAIVLGTTRLTEYCYYRATTTVNPHNPLHTPGGSSSGSAAAVAAGMADVAIGTQTIGSTIRPASFCGIYGFKPSFGAISMRGASALSYSMDHVGLFARRLPDLVTLFNVLRGYDPGDFRTRPIRERLFPTRTQGRVGVVDLQGAPVIEPELQQAIDRRLTRMRQNGWDVHPVRLSFTLEEVKQVANTLLGVETSQLLRDVIDTPVFKKFGDDVRGLVDAGLRCPMEAYLAAKRRRLTMHQEAAALFADDEFLVLPSAISAAPKGLSHTGDPICTVLTSLTGLPAVNVPVGFNRAGLPLGMQVIGAAYSDLNLLQRVPRFADGDLAPAKLGTP